MSEAGPKRIRLRHYTRASSKERILDEQRLLARDQNKVFVEQADRRTLPPRDAEATYLLKRGKGNSFVEFDAYQNEVFAQVNRLTGETEYFLRGNIELAGRNALGFDNR